MSGPTTIDTTGADAGQQDSLSEMVAAMMATNAPFTVIGSNSTSVIANAQALNQQDANNYSGGSSAVSPSVPAAPPTSSTGKSWWDSVLDGMSASGGASSVAVGPASQLAAAGSSDDSLTASMGGGNPTSMAGYQASAQGATQATAPVTSWISSHAGNYGLVVIGVLLGLGALLISQKQTIVSIGKTVGKAAAIAG